MESSTSKVSSRRSSMEMDNESADITNGESEGNILCSSLVAEEREQVERKQPVQQSVPHFYVIINPKSGGRKGELVMRKFEGLEHCIVNTVFEIDHDKLMHFITHSTNGRIIIGGGDGTINSVLTQLSHIHEHLPPIAVMPLGTGNELSRCTGWNSTYSLTDCVFTFLEQAKSGSVIVLDRWNINLSIPGQETVNKRMLCFFSIGFDAQIADSFDKWREKYPHLCFKQIVNKAWYLGFAMKEAIKTGTRISPYVDLYVDGHQVHVPFTVSCLHFMNIRSTGDGTDLFAPHQPHRKKDKKDIQKPSMCDQLLEVLGTDSLVHYLKIKYFNSHSHRIAQGKTIVLHAKRTFVAQLDGESWAVPEGSTVEISLCDQLQIVRGRRMIEH